VLFLCFFIYFAAGMTEGDTVAYVLKYISACSNHWSGVPRRESVINWIVKVVIKSEGGGWCEGLRHLATPH